MKLNKITTLIGIFILFLSTQMWSQAPDWDVNPSDFDFNMRITVNLNLGCGGAAPSGPYTVAVFIDGELAGVESVSGSTAFVTAYSNSAIGGIITFEIYDSANNEIENFGSNIMFTANRLGQSINLGNGGTGNADGDAFCDDEDPCPNTFQMALGDRDGDGIDDACDAYPDDDNRNDSDGDGIPDSVDDDDCGCNSPDQIIEVCINGRDTRAQCRRLADPGVVCGTCDRCAGTPCSDGDPCTVGETWNEDCTVCSGGVERDTDRDGVCDALDQCPGKDDNRDFDNDGVPDACDSDPACFTCEPDPQGQITFCVVYPNGRMSSFKGDCNNFGRYFDDEGDFTQRGSHCGPCTCTSIGDVDSDGDGVCDTKDECPDNPAIWLKGSCSCDDEDDNGDGEADSCTRTICSAEGDASYEWIEQITVNSSTMKSVENTGYTNYGKSRAIFTSKSNDVSVSVEPTCLGMDCHLSYAIYADWNDDKDFDDEDEIIAMHRGKGGLEMSFPIPEHSVDEPLIRVMADYGRITGPCDTHVEGEVEDMMLKFEEDCTLASESFDLELNSSIIGQSGGSLSGSPWTQGENSIGVSRVLQQSLYHPDVPVGVGGKLGLLNLSDAKHTVMRPVEGGLPLHFSFLYMRSGGLGTFEVELGGLTLSVDENGSVTFNGEKAEKTINHNQVYRFTISIDYNEAGEIVATLKYSDSPINSEEASYSTTLGMNGAINELKISIQDQGGFIPLAHYVDEIMMSCSADMMSKEQIVSTNKKEKSKSFRALGLNVFPNPAIGGTVSVSIENNHFLDGEIQVMDMNGRMVLDQPMLSGDKRLNTSELQSGVYLLVVRSSNQIAQRKIIVP